MSALFDNLAPGAVGVKICGITNPKDLAVCLEAGSDALGFNFYADSKRFLEIEKERDWLQTVPDSVWRVAVVVNPTFDEALQLLDEPFLDALQLHGDEPRAFAEEIRQRSGKMVIKALRVQNEASLDAVAEFAHFPVLLDAYTPGERGGTGHSFNWAWLDQFQHPEIVLSGGLNPENIAAALRLTKVRYVDVASGVENFPREKSAEKIRDFITQIRISGI